MYFYCYCSIFVLKMIFFSLRFLFFNNIIIQQKCIFFYFKKLKYLLKSYSFSIEFYPTAMRATGLGVASSVSRLGAASAPVISQLLADESITAALIVNATACAVAAGAALALPFETAGRKMRESVDEIPALIDPSRAHRARESSFERVVESQNNGDIELELEEGLEEGREEEERSFSTTTTTTTHNATTTTQTQTESTTTESE